MATAGNNNKKRKNHYRQPNKSVKKKGSYPLRPGVQGFFITCDGGRERQASQEAVQVFDSFLEDLAEGEDSDGTPTPVLPINKKIKFSYSDSEDDADHDDEKNDGAHIVVASDTLNDATPKNEGDGSETKEIAEDSKNSHVNYEGATPKNEGDATETKEITKDIKISHEDGKQQLEKKPHIEKGEAKCEQVVKSKVEEMSVDQLIEAELAELKDKSKRRFNYLDSGCNGVVFVEMRKRDEDPTPKEIAQRMITYAATTQKHMSRFILRVLPVEVTCYASEEEISRAIKPLIARYFPMEVETPYKFAVLCEARANSGVEKMKIINVVAKSVPEPHKVDLTNPDKTIVVQIAKTVCCIGVVDKYKELAKYNLRQLTSSKP
ncbi:uncharacterized protein [Rutidosis leptorrhynchoides]|uniref:uncharacterized protein n=1 Tax=Rutidosis leptorrhynchoides TaxID=125765 RepID=UPI003A9A5A68